MKKIIVLALALLMLTGAVSCAQPSDNIQEETTASTQSSQESLNNNDTPLADTSSDVAETTAAPDVDLPDTRYDNTELVFLHRLSDRTIYYSEYWIDATEMTGDIINDGIYNRNAKIFEKYGVKITSVENNSAYTLLNTSVKAGLRDYDVMLDTYVNTGTATIAGNLSNLNNLEYVDFDATYWDRNCAEQTTICNKLYGMVSDISLMTLASVRAIIFNRDLAKKLTLDDPYDLVDANKWTLDKMIEMIESVTGDLNGNGANDDNDLYGMLTEKTGGTSNISLFLTAFDVKLTQNNAEGIPEVSFMNERTSTVVNKLREVLNNSAVCRDYYDLTVTSSKWADGRSLFATDHFLFMQSAAMIFDELNKMEMQSEYGIVPNPKYDENQEHYVNRPDRYATLLSVPITNTDFERTGALLEAMAYYSHMYVLPEYYETTIKLKRARVPKMGEMMDIIRDSICYEITDIFNVNTVDCINAAFTSGNTSSAFKANSNVITKKIVSLIDTINKLP